LKEIKEAARSKQWEFEAVATNGTPARDYLTALKTHPRAWNVLLLDSDEPLGRSSANLLERKGLKGCDRDRIFWMVQLMESWFFADIEALESYYKRGFKTKAVRGNPEVEKSPKPMFSQNWRMRLAGPDPANIRRTRRLSYLD
jgi:hypothetical protein